MGPKLPRPKLLPKKRLKKNETFNRKNLCTKYIQYNDLNLERVLCVHFYNGPKFVEMTILPNKKIVHSKVPFSPPPYYPKFFRLYYFSQIQQVSLVQRRIPLTFYTISPFFGHPSVFFDIFPGKQNSLKHSCLDVCFVIHFD